MPPPRGAPSNPYTSSTVGRSGAVAKAAKNNSDGSSFSCGSGAAKALLYFLLLVALVAVVVVVYYAFSLRKKRSGDGKSGDDDEAGYVRYSGGAAEGFEEDANGSRKSKKSGGYRLIYFHMAGCVYCRKFDPTWKTFKSRYSSQMKSDKNVRLVSYAAEEKKARSFDVRGFPTVLLARADSDDIVATFNGERTVANLKKFVDDNAR